MKLIDAFLKRDNEEKELYASIIKNLNERDYTDWAIGEFLVKIMDVMEGDYA